MKKILLASNNQGKVERFRSLCARAGMDVELCTPSEYGVAEKNVVENGQSLAENARLKAEAYVGEVDIPVLANDTGFWLETEGFVDAPKRHALQGMDEQELSFEEVRDKLLAFWKQKAIDNGGKVNGAWVEAFVVIHPDGSSRESDSRREVILTDAEFAEPPLQMPIRALYYSKVTGKPAILHTEEEEFEEMQPVIDALRKVLD